MGRANQSHVHLDRAGSPDALKLAFLKHAQEFRLKRRCDLADFVQKQRAAIGQFEIGPYANLSRQ